MLPAIQVVLDDLLAGEELTGDRIEVAIGALMDGQASPVEIAALLTGLAVRGESSATLAGAARAMRMRATRVPSLRRGLLDTCGTGGDKLRTFNISTTTAIVVSALGVPVAKHGNRSATSSSGSAEVLQSLGVNIDLTPAAVARCIDEIGIGFCYARLLHAAMKHVAPIRQELGFRTLFNLLGPLCNPARAEHQLIGTSRNATAERIAGAVAELGTTRTFVVCGNNQLDEVALWGSSLVYDVTPAGTVITTWTAADFGLPECEVGQLQVNSPEESALVVRRVLANQPGPARDMVLANAAAALLLAGRCQSLPNGVELAAEILRNGGAAAKLEELVTKSHE